MHGLKSIILESLYTYKRKPKLNERDHVSVPETFHSIHAYSLQFNVPKFIQQLSCLRD